MESSPQLVTPPLHARVSFGKIGLPWGPGQPLRVPQGALRGRGAEGGAHWREVRGPASGLGVLHLAHWGSGVRAEGSACPVQPKRASAVSLLPSRFGL